MNRKKGVKLKERTELLYGIHPVLGALRHSKRQLNQLYIKKDADSSKRLRDSQRRQTFWTSTLLHAGVSTYLFQI